MTNNSGYELMFSASSSLRDEYLGRHENNAWEGSPFEWIKSRPSRQIGRIGEQMVSFWCRKNGLVVSKGNNTDNDLFLNNRPVEVKFSTLWACGDYVFQQIRNQDYEYLFLLGVSPFTVSGWFVPKEVAIERATPQHTGKVGTETFWIRFLANNPPQWMSKYGGDLSETIKSVYSYTQRR